MPRRGCCGCGGPRLRHGFQHSSFHHAAVFAGAAVTASRSPIKALFSHQAFGKGASFGSRRFPCLPGQRSLVPCAPVAACQQAFSAGAACAVSFLAQEGPSRATAPLADSALSGHRRPDSLRLRRRRFRTGACDRACTSIGEPYRFSAPKPISSTRDAVDGPF